MHGSFCNGIEHSIMNFMSINCVRYKLDTEPKYRSRIFRRILAHYREFPQLHSAAFGKSAASGAKEGALRRKASTNTAHLMQRQSAVARVFKHTRDFAHPLTQ